MDGSLCQDVEVVGRMNEADFDIAEAAERLDSEGMLEHLRNFADDLAAQWNIEETERELPDTLVCLGMGGSAASADFVAALADHSGAAAVISHRGYGLPNWTDKRQLFTSVSYSGNTEETLDATAAALASGAECISLSSGGKLADLGCDHVTLPGGQPPRSAFGHIFGALSRIAASAGIIKDFTAEIDNGILDRLRETIHQLDFLNNPDSVALSVARTLMNREIGIISAPELNCAGQRFANQLNENSGVFARPTSLPEMNHNEVIAWTDAESVNSQALLLLTWDGMHERVAKRIEWMTENIDSSVVWNIHCEGESLLEAMLYSCVAMDWISCALALLRGKDPSAIGAISDLKSHLAK